MRIQRTKFALLGISVLCLAALPALADVPSQSMNYPAPGTLDYIQGSANLAGKHINKHNLGNIQMNPGQVLHTQKGKAELLLTPGVFLRVGDHSAVKMISPDLANTKVALVRGEIGVEVDDIQPQNDLQIVDHGVTTQLLKRGFYEFIASHPEVLVFSGKAAVRTGNGRAVKVGGHHLAALVKGAEVRPHHFNVNRAKDNLYRWSKLRSHYLAEENRPNAHDYGYRYGWGWGGYPAWGWSPWAWGWGPGWGSAWGPWWGGGLGYWGGYAAPVYGGRFDDDDGGFHGGDHDGGHFHGGGHRH